MEKTLGNPLLPKFSVEQEEILQKVDISLINHSFQDFFQAFESLRTQHKDLKKIANTIPECVVNIAKFYGKKSVSDWIFEDTKNHFTCSDYHFSYSLLQYLIQNPQIESSTAQKFLLAVCQFYYNSNDVHDLEGSFENFMSHEPHDYTRPNGWYNHADYVSLSECREILLKKQRLEANDSEIKRSKEFFEQFPEFTNENLKVPYEVYCKCWTSLQDPATILPWSIEIVFSYVLENKLSLEYMFLKKAELSSPISVDPPPFIFPSLKWCGITDFLRLWITYTQWFETTPNSNIDRWSIIPNHCTRTIFLPTNSHYSQFWGVRTKSFSCYRDTMEEYFSCFGDVINIIGYGLVLTAQLTAFQDSYTNTTLQNDIAQKSLTRILSLLVEPLCIELRKVQRLVISWQQSPNDIPTLTSWKKNEPYASRFGMMVALIAGAFPFPKKLYDLEKLSTSDQICFESPKHAPKETWRQDSDWIFIKASMTLSPLCKFAKSKDLKDFTVATFAYIDFLSEHFGSIWDNAPSDIGLEQKNELNQILHSRKDHKNEDENPMKRLVDKLDTQAPEISSTRNDQNLWPRPLIKNL